MNLNATQIQEVATHISTLPGLTANAREELLDHLCCDIEKELSQGVSFAAAWATTQERWNEDEVQKIHSSTQNHFSMLKFTAGCLIAAVISLFSFDHGNAVELIDGNTPAIESLQFPTTTNPLLGVCNSQHTTRLDPPSTSPLAEDTQLTSAYGPARHPITKEKRFHQGIDFRADMGTPVLAAGAGKVVQAGPKGDYGNCIIIVHDEIYETLYAHLETISVTIGDYLTAGQSIGTVGSSGVSTGPHLHYEVIKNGETVNPADYLP